VRKGQVLKAHNKRAEFHSAEKKRFGSGVKEPEGSADIPKLPNKMSEILGYS